VREIQNNQVVLKFFWLEIVREIPTAIALKKKNGYLKRFRTLLENGPKVPAAVAAGIDAALVPAATADGTFGLDLWPVFQ